VFVSESSRSFCLGRRCLGVNLSVAVHVAEDWQKSSIQKAYQKVYLYTLRIQELVSVVVPVRVPRELAQKINELIARGLYPSRSDLIREALRRFIVSEGAFTQKLAVGHSIATLASAIIAWNEKTVTDVILFGSTARGEATIESDIDLLILTEKTKPWMVRQRLYDLIYPIIPALGVDISLIVIDKNSFTRMIKDKDPFATSTINEGIQLQGDFLNEYSKSTHGKSH